MRRFGIGDLALTVGLTVPSCNGHAVQVLKVLGPIPERKIKFGYEVERLDGTPFGRVEVWPQGKMIDGRPRDVRVHVEHENLCLLTQRDTLADKAASIDPDDPRKALYVDAHDYRRRRPKAMHAGSALITIFLEREFRRNGEPSPDHMTQIKLCWWGWRYVDRIRASSQ